MLRVKPSCTKERARDYTTEIRKVNSFIFESVVRRSAGLIYDASSIQAVAQTQLHLLHGEHAVFFVGMGAFVSNNRVHRRKLKSS